MHTPQDFGADDTGMSDSSGALQQWLNSAQERGAHLRVPPGIYAYSRVLRVWPRTTIDGPGGDQGIFQNLGAGGLFVLADPANTRGITIRGCAFDMHGFNPTFLSVINFSSAQVIRDIRIENNHVYDSQYPGDDLVEQRQWIVILNCQDVWITGNHLEHGGRIKAGRPGRRMVISRNIIDGVNDNAITVVDRGVGDGITEDVLITDNIIRNPQGAAIFVGSDGQNIDAEMTCRRIRLHGNIIQGDWYASGIQLTLPRITEDITVSDNVIVLLGTSRAPDSGINVTRQNGSTLPTTGVVLRGNTISRRTAGGFGSGGILLAGRHEALQVSETMMPTSALQIKGVLAHLRLTNNHVGRLRGYQDVTLTDAVIANNTMTDLLMQTTHPLSGILRGNYCTTGSMTFQGTAAHQVHVVDNVLRGEVRLENGATFAPEAQQYDNIM